jgi:hypothetical protein
VGGVRGKFPVEGECMQEFVGKTFREQTTWDT